MCEKPRLPATKASWQTPCLAVGTNVSEMKTLMLMGAMIGFALGIALGIAGRAAWPTTLWHACAAAAFLGWLMRWWARVWTSNLRDALEQRRATEAAARQQNPSTSAKK